MKNLSKIILGIGLIIVGLILGLNAVGITNINIFFKGWWTLFIIVPCFFGLFEKEDKIGNIIGIIIGILFLLSCQDLITWDIVWKLMAPAILIIIGISVIFKNFLGNKITKKIKEINSNNKDSKEYCAIFSGQKADYSNQEFKGCNVNAVFGGAEVNLANAIIKEDVVINVSSIFGGVDINVPNNVNVKTTSTSIFGGIENKSQNNEQNQFTIYINANCLFGGVKVK